LPRNGEIPRAKRQNAQQAARKESKAAGRSRT
jgi:hypothetical protein